jgi:putative endonuclease
MPHEYYVYILASTFQKLYTGVTNDLARRTREHKSAEDPDSFTTRHKVNKLVYYERFQYIQNAIAKKRKSKVGCESKNFNS